MQIFCDLMSKHPGLQHLTGVMIGLKVAQISLFLFLTPRQVVINKLHRIIMLF